MSPDSMKSNEENLREIKVRPIQKEDNNCIKRLIKTVMPEFGANGPGFAINDPEVEDMFESYSQENSHYSVATKEGKLLGGAGIGPLPGEDHTCELKKMYMFPEGRGLGLGAKLLSIVLEVAKAQGYKRCYLETLDSMVQANKLYAKFGFEKLSKPMGNTGHFSCDTWYVKEL